MKNAVTVAAAKAMSDALEALQKGADPVFDAVEKGLAPVTSCSRRHQRSGRGRHRQDAQGRRIRDRQAVRQAGHHFCSLQRQLAPEHSRSVEAPKAADTDTEDRDAKPAPGKDVLKALGVDKDSLQTKAKSTSPEARHAADARAILKKSVKETVAKVRGAVDDAAKDIKDATKDLKKTKQSPDQAGQDGEEGQGGQSGTA